MNFQIAIDGPSGTGKSTAAKLVSQRLGFTYIDTGAMYRAFGLFALNQGVDPADEAAVGQIIPMVNIGIERDDNGNQHVILNGSDVTSQLRTQEVGEAASVVSVHGAVRTKLTALQRELAQSANVIMDGRDICSYVLPNADIKIYMDADSRIRAERRVSELRLLNQPADFDTVKKEIEKRDERDKGRKILPLIKTDDSIVIDTGDLTIDEMVNTIINLYNNKKHGGLK